MSAITKRDILLTADGDIDVSKQDLQLTSGIDAVMQSVRIRLQFFMGEWFLDTTQGVPYFQQVLVKNPDLNALASIFRNVVLGTPGIKSLTQFSLDHDRQARTLSVTMAGVADFGAFDAQTVVLSS